MSKILLADDSPHARRMGETILREEGYQVTVVADGNAALAQLAEADPDLLIADAFLPQVDGLALCRAAKSRLAHVRVILTAGLLEPLDEAAAHAAGADFILRKPFEASVMTGAVRPLIEEAVAARRAISGEPPVRDAEARRVLAHAIANGREGFPVKRPVPRVVEEGVARLTARTRLEIVERATDPSDGFVKYLFRLRDGALAEAVRIPLEVERRFTVCLSSQAGCAMGCTFCATGRLGLIRSLEPWEIVAQFVAVRDEAPGTVTGAVFQGQGEPLHNYANVIRAAEILAHPCGGRIAAKAITISTVGLVPAIQRYARERQPYRLIVSLTSAIDENSRPSASTTVTAPLPSTSNGPRCFVSAAGAAASRYGSAGDAASCASTSMRVPSFLIAKWR